MANMICQLALQDGKLNVHVNARSLLYRQTHMTMQSGVIAGASNAGLKDPGVHTAYSIGQLTALLVPEPVTAIDDLVILNVIIRLRKAAAKGFAKARKRLDLEHAEQRGFPTRRLYLDYLGTEFSKNLGSIRTEDDARHVNDPHAFEHFGLCHWQSPRSA